MPFSFGLVVFIVLLLASAIRILKEYERGVIFRLGRVIGSKGPGIIFLIPLIDKMVKVSLRTVVMDVPPQDVITKDNVSVQVNAVLYFRVVDPVKHAIAECMAGALVAVMRAYSGGDHHVSFFLQNGLH